MKKMDQNRAPIYEALQRFREMRVVPFDVPGHKHGRGNPELTAFLGEKCVSIDVNSMKPLDNLCHPVSVIKEAELLAADAFGAAYAFLMVGGTTSSVQSMVLSTCKRGDKIILPRNVHRSVINALVLCGAVPVYVNPGVDRKLGISLGMQREQVARAIAENPDAVAVLINNPTYYGICSDLRAIVKMAHDANMLCLVDEAHGTHFYFGENMPVSAMQAGADMAAVSMHKSGGSLTQSSLLLIGEKMNPGHVRQIINLTQTTSGSYLLMSSLDISRRNLALCGKTIFAEVVEMAEYARE
jgi:arginine/lysine/ornithine decarboxylase